MNSKDRRPALTPLGRIVQKAKDGAVETLILSSEDFIWAFPDRLAGYADALAGCDVVLVSTQSSLPNRIASIWQERIKHGGQDTMDQSIEHIFSGKRAFQPGLLKGSVDALKPREIVIIYSQPQDAPHVLIDRFTAAMGLPTGGHGVPDPSIRRNARLGWIEVETLRHFNTLLTLAAPDIAKEDYLRLRNVLLRGFRSDAWRVRCPRVAIDTPAAVVDRALSAASRLATEITDIAQGWPVRTFGDPQALFVVADQNLGAQHMLRPSPA